MGSLPSSTNCRVTAPTRSRLWALGLYTDPASTPETKDNVRLLWPELWPSVAEETRHAFGTKHARYAANAEKAQSLASRELLDLVNGQAYLPEPIRAANLSNILDALLAAHHGLNNFYNEPSPARALEAFVGERGDVPEGVVDRYSAVLVEVFLTNGHGVAFSADPVYRRLLERLDSRGAGLALRAIRNPAIATRSCNTRIPQGAVGRAARAAGPEAERDGQTGSCWRQFNPMTAR